MAPAPPAATTWPRPRRTFLLRPLALLLALAATLRPASSQLLQPPPGAALNTAFSPPPPPASAAAAGGGGTYTFATSLLFLALIAALFLLGFFSAYLRRRADAAATAPAGASAAVAAAFASAAAAGDDSGGGRGRRAGLDAAAMDALPLLTHAAARALKAGRGALECAVCLAEFGTAAEKLRLLPGCCHVFHAACIDVWLAAHVTCPVCRADLSDPAVADAGHVLAADLAAHAAGTAPSTDAVVVDVDPAQPAPGRGCASSSSSYDEEQEPEETAEERADRYTLRLPERLKREIDKARRHRRAVSAVAAAAAAAPSGRWTSSDALRTMSAARPSRRWSGLFRALSGSRRSEPDGHRRVVPLHTSAAAGEGGDHGEVEVVVVQDDVDKYYAHSLTFAGFVIDGDVAAGDWNPEVFQVQAAVPANTSQR